MMVEVYLSLRGFYRAVCDRERCESGGKREVSLAGVLRCDAVESRRFEKSCHIIVCRPQS